MKSILAFLRKQAIGVLVLIAVLYQIALGTSIEKKTINQIVVEADWLIHGTVLNLHEADDPNLKGLYAADIEVYEYLKGNRLDKWLTVKWCGQVGNEHYLTDVLPKFEVGDTVIVALRQAEQIYYVVGAYQGAFRIKQGRIVGTTILEEEFLAQLRALVSHLKLNGQQPSPGLFKTEGRTDLLTACNPIDCSGYEGTELQQYSWVVYSGKWVRWNYGNMNPTIYINMTNAKTKNEKNLAEQEVPKALENLEKYRESNTVYNAELLANIGIIKLEFMNDLAGAEEVLAQLRTLAALNDQVAVANENSLSIMIEKYCQDLSDKPLPRPANDSPASPTNSKISLQVGNYPNPFNPETTIRFHLTERQKVRLFIYDLAGKRVRTLVEGELPAGAQKILWDGRDQLGRLVASGVYFYELVVGNKIERKKMTLIR